jgi:hypothetical protein
MLYLTPIALAVILGGGSMSMEFAEGADTTTRCRSLGRYSGQLQGTIESVEPDKADAEFATNFVQQVRDRATHAKADGQLNAEVQFGADGSLKVRDVNGSGALAGAVDTVAFERYLRGSGQRYDERAAPGKPHVAVDKVVPLILTVYYTWPYIWLARGIVLGSTFLFLLLIAVAWKRHHARRTT